MYSFYCSDGRADGRADRRTYVGADGRADGRADCGADGRPHERADAHTHDDIDDSSAHGRAYRGADGRAHFGAGAAAYLLADEDDVSHPRPGVRPRLLPRHLQEQEGSLQEMP